MIFSSFSLYSDKKDRPVQALHTTEKRKKRIFGIWETGGCKDRPKREREQVETNSGGIPTII